MKIVGIVPSTPSPYLRFGIFRLGLPILLTKAKKEGHEAIMVDENISDINLEWLREELRRADLAAFSALTPTYNRTKWFNQWIKKDLGLKIPTAIGGVHPTFETEKVLNDGFDFVFRHEGELVFTPFLEALENGDGFSLINNLCYRQREKMVFNPLSAQLPDLDRDSPFPDFLDKELFPQWNKKCMAVIETSRSCPFRCSFCSVHPMFGPVRERKNLTALVEEIKRLNPGFVFFCDDHFASYQNTGRSKELFLLMLRKLDKIPAIGAQIRSDAARDEEWLRLAKRVNLFFACIGFESINPASLKEARKGQTIESVETDIANFKKHGLGHTIHASLIVGFDADDKDTARRTVDWAMGKMGIYSMQMGIVTPLPGTEFWRKLENEGRLLPQAQNPELCDGLHALFTHPNFENPAELQKSVEEAIKRIKLFKPFVSGLLGWTKDWLMSCKNKIILERNFRKWYVRLRMRKSYRIIKKQAGEYLDQLKSKT